MEKIIDIIGKMKETAKDREFVNKHKNKKTSFGRKSGKIDPCDIMFFVMSLIKTTLDFEIMHYCRYSSMENVVASSISKARKKLKYSAFEELLEVVTKEMPITNKFKGYRVSAIDGMEGELQKTPELMKKYNGNHGQYPMFHAVAVYDVLNKMFLKATFLPAPTDERKAAIDLIEKLSDEKNEIILVDRGFPSIALLQQFDKSGKKFVMRVSKSFLKEVNEFSQSKENDSTIHIDYDKRRGATSRIKNVVLPYAFDLRCIKITLSGGEIETLITNLPSDEFSITDIASLYNMRWGIETSYNHLKNAVHVEDFVGVLENSIIQEFYASLIFYNIATLFSEEAQNIYDSKKNEKH